MARQEYIKEPKWYVVHTYSGYENKVKRDLEQVVENRGIEDYIFKIVVPKEEQITIRAGKRESVKKNVYPSYVLVKMIVTEETWYIVRNTSGVTGFVGAGTNPIPISDAEVRRMGIEGDVSEEKVVLDYQIGDSVEILVDPLKGHIGEVVAINKEQQKVKVILPMFSRGTNTELEFSQVQKVIK